jgi:D-alanyl-D-alanine carboxypeptidase
MRRLVIAVGLAFATPAVAADLDTLKTALRADLEHYLASRRAIEHISALSLSVSLPGEASTLDVAAGAARTTGGDPVTPANIYQIGSNTKAFTAVTILQLEAEGKLTIKDALGQWLPQYPAWKDVTIEQLLNMTSGIPTYDNVQAMQAALAAAPLRDWSPAELIAYVEPTTPGAPPATKGWSYSNTNYLLAQLIIEKASGHSYAEELRRRFLGGALGLSDAYYEPSLYPASVVARMVSGYFASHDPLNDGLQPLYGKDMRDLSLSWAQGAGGMVATPADLTHWARALYKGPMLQPRQRAELLRTISLASGQEIDDVSADNPRGFGLGVLHAFTPTIGKFWGYQGETLGYRMLYAWFPESDVVVAFGINSQPDEKENHSAELLETIYQTLRKSGAM